MRDCVCLTGSTEQITTCHLKRCCACACAGSLCQHSMRVIPEIRVSSYSACCCLKASQGVASKEIFEQKEDLLS